MEKLKRLRKERKIKSSVIAEYLDISRVYYWQLETNKRRLSYENAIKIATFFKMKPDELFYEDFIKENINYQNKRNKK